MEGLGFQDLITARLDFEEKERVTLNLDCHVGISERNLLQVRLPTRFESQ